MTIKNRLQRGNSKLGETIYTFSLPPGITCPGESDPCRTNCYAKQGHFLQTNVRDSYADNLDFSRWNSFHLYTINEIRRRSIQVVRIHVAGDFYDSPYVAKWIEVAKHCPQTSFYAYTRSWRISAIRPELERFSALDNVRLWYSCDRETGIPTDRPEGINIAWMQTDATDLPYVPLTREDVVFRTKRARRTPAKRVSLALVCPKENGQNNEAINRLSCSSCKFCL